MPERTSSVPLPLDGGRSIVFGTNFVRRAQQPPLPLDGGGVGVNTMAAAMSSFPPIPPFPRQGGRGTCAVRQSRAEQYWGRVRVGVSFPHKGGGTFVCPLRGGQM
jgi:hypothetical protein